MIVLPWQNGCRPGVLILIDDMTANNALVLNDHALGGHPAGGKVRAANDV